jgi:hypothetical protein
MSSHDQIIYAIKNRRALSFVYDGCKRVVEPHAYGEAQSGDVLRAFQIAGQSNSGKLGWHLFLIEKMQNFSVDEAVFAGPRPGYKRGDPAMSRIYAEL